MQFTFKCLENPLQQQRDVVIVTVPWTDSSIPLMAPAQLKPVVESTGMSCLATDINVEVFKWTRNHPNQSRILDFFFNETIYDDTSDELFNLHKNMAEQIMSWKPKVIGLSLLTYVSQHSARWLSWFIKKIDPDITVVIGGSGCLPAFTGPSEFAKDLISKGLIDYHIRGDGEHSLYEFLKGKRDYIGINSLEWRELPMEEMRRVPMPDYKDYKIETYLKKALPITGSRGCVRKCTFCDYIANWKKFNWREAEDIFQEMLKQYEIWGLRIFKFQDSLTNGNMKEFIKLCELLTNHNTKNPDSSFEWSGYYIFREHNLRTRSEWDLVKGSGATTLSVGIENLNQHIRYDIGKKFSNEAIDVHLSEAQRVGVDCSLLNIVGYVNETQKDIDFIKEWLYNHTQYQDILYLSWGGTLGIFQNTWLERNYKKLGVERIGTAPEDWINRSIDSTPQKRAKWAQELVSLSKELGYRVMLNTDNHYLLEKLMNDKQIYKSRYNEDLEAIQ